MYKKFLALLLCLISVIFVTNPAMAIERNSIIIDKYSTELTSYVNVSENSEPIMLARERSSRNSGSGEMSWLWIGSIFITGLGQILLGEIGRGLLFLGGAILGGVVIYLLAGPYYSGSLITIFGLAIQLWSVFDAYGVAKRKSEGDEEARLINEKLAKIEQQFNKISIENQQLKYSLANF